MRKNYKKCHKGFLFALLLGFLVIPICIAQATSVDRVSICNLEGFPGETIEMPITLEGIESEERSGFWYTHYKKTEGDDNRMDITSWITIEPKDYTIKQGEIKVFTVKVKIPRNAEPGLWGVTSENACREGYSDERRTYIVFKDTVPGGNVYSGLLIPISVKVLASPNPLALAINFIKQNILLIFISVVIIVSLASLLFKKRKQVDKE